MQQLRAEENGVWVLRDQKDTSTACSGDSNKLEAATMTNGFRVLGFGGPKLKMPILSYRCQYFSYMNQENRMFYKEPMQLKGQRVWGLGDQKDRNTAQEEILTTSFWSTATKTRV